MGSISVLMYMIELSETNQPLFTELKNLAPLPRYRVSPVAKMAVFHTLAKFQMRFLKNHLIEHDLTPESALELKFGPEVQNKYI